LLRAGASEPTAPRFRKRRIGCRGKRLHKVRAKLSCRLLINPSVSLQQNQLAESVNRISNRLVALQERGASSPILKVGFGA
jgi:hypothetical protein